MFVALKDSVAIHIIIIIIMVDSTSTNTISANDTDGNSSSDNSGVVCVHFRPCRPTDIPRIAALEESSYPRSEAATKTQLQYRQHHAARYFSVAVLGREGEEDESSSSNNNIVGFICATRTSDFTHASMSVHDPSGSYLAIHSVVVAHEYRNKGIATQMILHYVKTIEDTAVIAEDNSDDEPIQKIVLLAKANLLPFYVKCGFRVM
jgi:ribosomal protein S18 acetylase RimI-like enzyme